VAKPQEILFKVWQSHRKSNPARIEFFSFPPFFANQEIRLKEGKILAIS